MKYVYDEKIVDQVWNIQIYPSRADGFVCGIRKALKMKEEILKDS